MIRLEDGLRQFFPAFAGFVTVGPDSRLVAIVRRICDLVEGVIPCLVF